MIVEKSGQATDLDSDHGDVNECFCAGQGGFIVTNQSAVMHQPAERALDDPATRQHFKAAHVVGTFDDLDVELGTAGFNPVGKGGASIATIGPTGGAAK